VVTAAAAAGSPPPSSHLPSGVQPGSEPLCGTDGCSHGFHFASIWLSSHCHRRHQPAHRKTSWTGACRYDDPDVAVGRVSRSGYAWNARAGQHAPVRSGLGQVGLCRPATVGPAGCGPGGVIGSGMAWSTCKIVALTAVTSSVMPGSCGWAGAGRGRGDGPQLGSQPAGPNAPLRQRPIVRYPQCTARSSCPAFRCSAASPAAHNATARACATGVELVDRGGEQPARLRPAGLGLGAGGQGRQRVPGSYVQPAGGGDHGLPATPGGAG
jgi:hypothetical protein